MPLTVRPPHSIAEFQRPDMSYLCKTPLLFCLAVVCCAAAPAEAQWYTSLYLGANHTRAADVSIDQPSLETAVRFNDVTFAARSLESPQYYGIRIGRHVGERRRFGVELEFIHLKVIAQTERDVRTHGTVDGVPVDAVQPMDQFVQQYAMTHGLNFFIVNLVRSQPVSSRGSVVGRVGVGGTMPHAESTIRGVNREQYEYAGPGMHASAGYEFHVRRWLSLFTEYKFTAARPAISVHAGTGQTTAVSHHVAAGFTFGSQR